MSNYLLIFSNLIQFTKCFAPKILNFNQHIAASLNATLTLIQVRLSYRLNQRLHLSIMQPLLHHQSIFISHIPYSHTTLTTPSSNTSPYKIPSPSPPAPVSLRPQHTRQDFHLLAPYQ